MPDSLMDQARRAIWQEQTEDAQAILINVIAREPENEEAWLLLAEAIADADKKRDCLERARAINPRNRAISRALQRLGGPTPTAEPAIVAAPKTAPPPLPPPAPDPAPPALELELVAAPMQSAAPLVPPEPVAQSMDALFDEGETLVKALMMTIEPMETREVGCQLLHVLDEAAAHDAGQTRRWARSAGREALLKYEKALTASIATLPRDDPQLTQLREQRHRALSYLR